LMLTKIFLLYLSYEGTIFLGLKIVWLALLVFYCYALALD
jgi:hypothetical protein